MVFPLLFNHHYQNRVSVIYYSLNADTVDWPENPVDNIHVAQRLKIEGVSGVW
jgi:hypothetical protein